MRKFKVLIVAIVLVASSCTTTEQVEETNNETFLKSYKLTRDSRGKYSIDYELKENTAVDVVNNIETNTNELHFFSGKVSVDKKQSTSFFLEENQLNFNFFQDGVSKKKVTVEDDAIVLAKGEESEEFLESYSITDLGDDNFQLDFKVKEGISAWYEYNEETDSYEVHLKPGVPKGLEFSKTYIKTSGVLKINFVNYKEINSAKGSSAKFSTVRKPKIYTS